ncbi:hypothetical protein GV828_03680 [Flavobacterium sp. NST-5]|uniref:Uncharacterized protein n=1 Tax=Flavobacterium ichthyis TaxID=2698827 RepID=A0ABW9Z648_9FLAO|nr:hypothetical protein [Flavobacterium ichthyis]NBL64300.1 hypothetical protein [Flavobacterium ichthyis]
MKNLLATMILLAFVGISCKETPKQDPETTEIETAQPAPSPTTNVPTHPQPDATEVEVDSVNPNLSNLE